MISVSVDVLPTSTPSGSPLHIASVPSSVSAGNIEKLRLATLLASVNADDADPKSVEPEVQPTVVSQNSHCRQQLLSSSSVDIEACRVPSPGRRIGHRPSVPSRRSVDIIRSMPSPSCAATISYRPSLHQGALKSTFRSRLASNPSLTDFSPICRRSAATAGGQQDATNTTATLCLLTDVEGGDNKRPLTDLHPVSSNDLKQAASDDEKPTAGGNGSSQRRLTNGIASGLKTVPDLQSSPNGCDVIDRLPVNRLSSAKVNPSRSLVKRLFSIPNQSTTASSSPDTRKSSMMSASTSRRRRRTLDTPPRREVAPPSGQSSPFVFNVSDVSDVDRGRLLDCITKEELFEMWQSSERSLNDQLRVAFEQHADLQRRLQRVSSTERLTVT